MKQLASLQWRLLILNAQNLENDWKGLRYKLECNQEEKQCSCDEKNERRENKYDKDNEDSNSEEWLF